MIVISKAHSQSRLQLEKQVVSADNNTIGIWHFDNHLYSSRGIKPIGSPVIVSRDGKFGKAIAIEESTTNLLVNPLMNTTSGWGGSNSSTLSVQATSPSGTFPSGATACIKNTATTANGFTVQVLNLQLNTKYTVSAWIYSPSTNASSSAINVWYDNAGWQGIGGVSVTERDKWVYMTYTFTSNSTYTTHTIGFGGSGLTVGNASYACMAQLEQKTYATSFINGSRTVPTKFQINGINAKDFTISFWFKPDVQYYNAMTSQYNRVMASMYDSDLVRRIDYVDWVATPGGSATSSLPFYDLEPNASWDAAQTHWHHTSPYTANKWHQYFFIKSGSTMRILILRDGSSINDTVWTYSTSSKLSDFTLTRFELGSSSDSTWNGTFDELRIDKVAYSTDELTSWHLSEAPFYDPIDTTSLSI